MGCFPLLPPLDESVSVCLSPAFTESYTLLYEVSFGKLQVSIECWASLGASLSRAFSPSACWGGLSPSGYVLGGQWIRMTLDPIFIFYIPCLFLSSLL